MQPETAPKLLFPKLGLSGHKTHLSTFSQENITERYLSWLTDPEVVRFSNQRFRKHTIESSQAYLQSFANSDNLFLSIRDLESKQTIGTLTVYVALPHATADIGILIGERSIWGQGMGLDAWQTVLDWLLKTAKIRKVTAGTLACNLGMRRIFERSGMHWEATRRAQEIVEGREEDILYYAKFRSE